MAIVFKNPMPSAGALFLTNPRKRKNRKPRRRKNAGQPRRSAKYVAKAMDADGVKLTAAGVKGMSKAKFDQYKTAGRALKEATKGKGGLQMLLSRPKGKKMFKISDAVERAILERMSVVDKKYQTQKKGVQTPDSNRLTALDRRHKGRKTTSIFSGDPSVVPAFTRTPSPTISRKPPRSAAQRRAAERLGALNKMRSKYIRDGMSKAEAKKLARDMLDMYDQEKIANPRRRKNRRSKTRNPWFGAKGSKGGHAGAAYMRWGEKAKGKKLLAAYHKAKAARLRKKGKKVRGKKSDKMKLFSIVAKEYKGRKYKNLSNRMKAIWREVDKRAAGKKASKKRPSSARKKAAKKGKANKWVAFMKKMGGRGLTMTQLKRLYKKPKAQQQLAMKRLKKMRKRKGESTSAAKKRYQKRARGMVRQRGKRQAQMGPWMLRLNPRRRNGLVSWYGGVANKAQDLVSKVPVVGNVVAPFVIPAAVGFGLYHAHSLLEPMVVPAVKEGLDMLGKLPLVGGVAQMAAAQAVQRPYLVTGLAVSTLGAMISSYYPKVLSKKGAMALGAGAVSVGVVLDSALKPFAKAAAEVTVEATAAAVESADMGGFGDGGAYLIGAPTSALGPANFGAIGMDSSQMGGAFGALAAEYSDANMMDAHQTPADFHPDEIAALMSGPLHFQEKFGVSPSRLRKTIHDYSRHAGRPGHRFGWAIKMIGFQNVQKIAALPPHQRHYVLRQLKKQALEAAPKLIAQAQQRDLGAIESASLDLNGSFNGSGGAFGSSYGALMFAGNNY